MSNPLTRPQPPPTARATSTITIQCVSSAIVWVDRVVAQTEASATIAPTDRSIPPPVMTKVMPMLTTPMTEARRRIVSMLSTLRKRSPAVTPPTMIRITRAITRPRLRPTELSMTRANCERGSAVSTAAASTRPCSSGGGTTADDGVFWSLMRHVLP